MVITPAIASSAVNKPNSALSIEIEPDESNVDTGDRSSNRAEVTVTTPNREASFMVSREQAIEGLDRRFQRQALTQIAPDQAISPRVLQALQQSDVSSEDISEVAILRRQRERVNTYLDSSSANTGQNNSNPANTMGNNGADLYNKAVNAYVKQTLFFSAVDRAEAGFSTTA